jgi:hypothetical protein
MRAEGDSWKKLHGSYRSAPDAETQMIVAARKKKRPRNYGSSKHGWKHAAE